LEAGFGVTSRGTKFIYIYDVAFATESDDILEKYYKRVVVLDERCFQMLEDALKLASIRMRFDGIAFNDDVTMSIYRTGGEK